MALLGSEKIPGGGILEIHNYSQLNNTVYLYRIIDAPWYKNNNKYIGPKDGYKSLDASKKDSKTTIIEVVLTNPKGTIEGKRFISSDPGMAMEMFLLDSESHDRLKINFPNATVSFSYNDIKDYWWEGVDKKPKLLTSQKQKIKKKR